MSATSLCQPNGRRRTATIRTDRWPQDGVYRRRRRATFLAVVGLVALLLVGGYGIAGADSAGTVPLGDRGRPDVSRVHVVRPGDTLWSIARRAQPAGDVRPLVRRLAQQTGVQLDVGMRVELPG